MPREDWWIPAFFWIFLLFAISLTVGFCTRISSVAVFLCLTSLHQRNVFILNSGDTLMRITGFFLMFAPAGAAISVDRLLRIWRGREGVAIPPRAPWAQRMIQFQVAVTYLATFYWKTLGSRWIDGTALHYVMRLDEFRRFPVPEIQNAFLLKAGAWMTLLIEFSCAVLIWFRETRYAVLLVGACFQLSIEYSMNIPLFEWIIISTYVTFIPPEDLTRFWMWIRQHVSDRWPGSAVVIYDGRSLRPSRAANILRAIDIFGRLQILDFHSAEARNIQPGLTREHASNKLLFVTGADIRSGWSGLMSVAPLVPALWPLAPAAPFVRHSKQVVSATAAAK
jgi:hypothetical protein